ncbi:MAG: hypothetical protein LQ349_000475 [Xanthoria aureola]|nr:MAG: hypothetical protein LQ349_000475 [Xanthoria aureola]
MSTNFARAVLAGITLLSLAVTAAPTVTDGNVSYIGKDEAGVESFLGIRYGLDTGGTNRFKKPIPFLYPAGTLVSAAAPGAACPQQTGNPTPSLIGIFGNVSEISEDCLTIRVDRPFKTDANASLPVMAYLYGGGYAIGQVYDTAYDPTGLVRETAAKGLPVIYVAINYRVGIFGFAASAALRGEDNLNVGLLDQHLGLRWVQDHIAAFGGDRDNVTILGEDVGWANVAFQMMAYGGQVKPTFKRAMLMSGPTPGGDEITRRITEKHVSELTAIVKCDSPTGDSVAELKCLRELPLDTLVGAAVKYSFAFDAVAGVGTFRPTAPSSFLPSSPFKLLQSGRFLKNIDLVVGWCEDDGTQFISGPINNASAFTSWVGTQFPTLSAENNKELLSLYPTSDFEDLPSEGVDKNYFRAARVLRDVHFACPSLLLTDAVKRYSPGSDIYLWALNLTVFRAGHAAYNRTFVGQDHFSDIPYVFNYVDRQPYASIAEQEDYDLASRMSGSWAAFARFGHPNPPSLSVEENTATNGSVTPWTEAFSSTISGLALRIIGGPRDGMTTIPLMDQDKKNDSKAFYNEQLAARCGFWNRPDVAEQTFM